ncbi:hypothetical protein [Brachybacterium sp. GPGPB12]|uniref:hypothetical protein n=1 Tax=Brachybacterium sp. GPGPB12 TaxID=3023517 RepID=UPI00313434A6
MSTDEYVPSDEEMIHWFEGEDNPELARDLWNTWLAAHDARVRRDAAREALDGLVEKYGSLVDRTRIADYRDTHYGNGV